MNYAVCTHLNLASHMSVRLTCVVAGASSALQGPEHFLICLLLGVWNAVLAVGGWCLVMDLVYDIFP